MTDSKALRDWIDAKGLKMKKIASELHITPYSLQKKIDNMTEFKASEIAVFVTEFGMSKSKRDEIFFNKV
ncbi:toxin-antitoxin system, antitoxin component, Xre family protein [Bacilliculturomica massiliensis]|uniref:toxin-antitoxin system, antitoxin component, Xre family protein n=1 Tax=Bacilliculturomica massiliensis TaxID=1917867 RepID=UPI001030EC9B|nr:toxin-antitoxin system, antitoxin component, Xre family protein [Bacilliculturomica massiliensis]